MKFTCDRCGKRFSSVDEPMPGRVYRIRCRCGNAIQITAPHLMPGAAQRRKGGMAPRDGAEHPAPAIPPLPAGPRAATPAGDAAAPVRQTGGALRPVPVVARRPEPPPRPPAPLPSFAGMGAAPGLEHPQATPASVLMPDAPEPALPRAPGAAFEPPVLSGGDAAGIAVPQLEDFAPDRAATVDDLLEPISEPGVPLDDPFAAAAAHAARLETTAPSFPSPRIPTPLFEPEPPVGPVRDEVPPRILAPRPPDDETAVELSVSEQYPLPAPKASGRGRTVALAAVLLVVAGAAGAYVWRTRLVRPAPRAVTQIETAPLRPAQAPLPPTAAPEPRAPAAAPQPAAGEPEPRPAGAERRGTRTAAAERRAEAAARKAEAEAARRAEAEKKAEAQRAAAAERKAQEEIRAEEARRVDAERKAEADRKADEARRADAERRAEAARKAEAERKARAERRAAAPAAEPAVTEAVKHKDESAAPKAPAPATDGLDPAAMQAVIRAHRAALESCVERALADPATAVYAGRKVSLIILVAPNGRAEAAIEEPDLDASPFGTCLRRAASRMTFPAFRGEPVGARIPLVLGKS